MAPIPWGKFPTLAEHQLARRWLQFMANIGRASNTIDAYRETLVCSRTVAKVNSGAGSAAAALAMIFELVECARPQWRAVNAAHLVALVRAGARFERGHLVGCSESHAA
ncbi:hypothetical protein [Streptomyces sp. NBC_00019]|uniref:hypothetical protein n=1 Tax=Streptomyces sp. NBC_00019 TaxID=2975623 RepID=UPI00386D6994